MKLKKIASLALAGIMAVSMLAGCKDGSNQEDPSSSSQVPTTANVVTYANDALTGAQKNVYTFHDNAELNTALQAVATDKTKCTAKKIEDASMQMSYVKNNGDLTSAVKGKLSGSLTFQDNYTTFGAANTIPTNNGKTLSYIETSMMSGELSEKAVAEITAEYFAKYMGDLASSEGTNGTYKYDYSADISAIKVASPQNSAKTAWVVAVMITKTATETGNL